MKKSLFKSKLQMVVYSILFVICIILFIVIGQIDFQKDIDTESKLFSKEYNMVKDDNLYVYSNATEVLNIINGRSGVILMGFPTNKWMNYTANILNNVCEEFAIDKIYYYNFLKDRDESNGTYETIINKIKSYVLVDDEGVSDLKAPTVLIVKKGEIIGYFDDNAITRGAVSPDEYFTDIQKEIVYGKYKNALEEYIK